VRHVACQQHAKSDTTLQPIPVIVLATSSTDADVLHSYQRHANGYVAKPVTADIFITVIQQINYFFGSVARLPRQATTE